MKATIIIEMDNAAFDDHEAGPELSRCLEELAKRVHPYDKIMIHNERFSIFDLNGNLVGQAVIA